MNYKKDMHGYFIEVESLNPNKDFSEYREDAEMLYRTFNEKSYKVPSSLGFTLVCDGVEVEEFHLWLSDGLTELASKLQAWSKNKPYYIYELEDDQKEEYINRMMDEFIHDRDVAWLQEIFEDDESSDFYHDASLNEITSYLWDVFCNSNTMNEIDNTLESVLGYYGDAMVFNIEGDGYYLFFN